MSDKTRELILDFRSGNQKAFSELSEIYFPVINSMTLKYSSMCENVQGGDYQDLFQEASIAFYRSAMTYDIDNTEVSFGLYAKICIRNALVSALRRIKRSVSSSSKRRAVEKQSENTDPAARVIDKESKEKLLESFGQLLSKYEKQVLSEYLSGKKVHEISVLVGREEKSVSNALFRCRTKLGGKFNSK